MFFMEKPHMLCIILQEVDKLECGIMAMATTSSSVLLFMAVAG